MYVKDWESPYLAKTIRAPKIAPFRAHLPGNLFAHRTANDAVSSSVMHPLAVYSRWRCGGDSLMALRAARKAELGATLADFAHIGPIAPDHRKNLSRGDFAATTGRMGTH
jgi:hypothetical protein